MNKILLYMNDVVAEMKKVVWPSRETLLYSTVLVVVVSLFFAIYIFGIDKILSQLVGLIL